MFYTGRSDLLSDAKAFDACLVARESGNSSLRIFAEDVCHCSHPLRRSISTDASGDCRISFLSRHSEMFSL